jgi:hypothetical protein
MSWLKRALGLQAQLPKGEGQAPGNPAVDSPFGLGSGRLLEIDPSLALLLRDNTELVLPAQETVWAQGWVDLGQSQSLRRFYFDNEDYWLQVVMTGTAAEDVGDIILFGYDSATTVNSEAELKRLVGPQSPIGLPLYLHNEYEFERQWGTEPGQTELTPMLERITSPEQSYEIKHLSLLYARDIGLTERREFLLFSVEEDADGVITLSTSLGVTLNSTDFRVI